MIIFKPRRLTRTIAAGNVTNQILYTCPVNTVATIYLAIQGSYATIKYGGDVSGLSENVLGGLGIAAAFYTFKLYPGQSLKYTVTQSTSGYDVGIVEEMNWE